MPHRAASVRWCGALLLVVAVPALAQSKLAPASGTSATGQTTAQASPKTSPPPAPKAAVRPDFKNLRFEESYTTAQRSAHWDDAIKAIPLLGDRPVTLTIGGQLRWREESFRKFNLGAQDDDNAQSRLLLHADLQAGRRKGLYSRVFVEGRDAQSYGRTLPGGARPNDADRHDVQNLFAEVGHGASFVRVGRQETALGRERLIGVPDWSNTRRGAQGARAQLVRGAFALDLIDERPIAVRQTGANLADSTNRFRVVALGSASGAKAWARGLPATWQAYWIDQTVQSPTSFTRRLTSGARTQWQRGTPQSRRTYSLELEGAVQHGHAGARTLDGWFWIAESQVQFRRVHGAPSLALGVEEASGERSATTGTQEAFNVLYPAAHGHGGYADVIGRQNMREWHAISTWDARKSVALRGAWYRFNRLQLDDGAWTKSNTVFRAANGSTERHVADEFDLTGTWKASRHWKVIAGGAVVLPGPFLRHTPGSARTERWGFVGTAFTF